MFRKYLTAAMAMAAIVAAAPVVAAPGGHGGGGGAAMQGGAGASVRDTARVTGQGSVNASSRAMERANGATIDTRIQTNTNNTTRATKSQGPEYANPRAIERANQNSVLARNSVASATLPGLTTGLTVNDSTGTSIGTVSQVITGTDGSIRMVIVTDTSGQQIRLMPNMLTISGGVVTTTQTDLGD